MAWTLTATGQCATAEDERELADKLARLLAAPKSGTTASHMSGETVNGPVHEAPAKKASDGK
jgi:uncharacterized protein YhfF